MKIPNLELYTFIEFYGPAIRVFFIFIISFNLICLLNHVYTNHYEITLFFLVSTGHNFRAGIPMF